ncbi:MAG: hypothetical protein ACRDQ5_01215 [Sciscionella sp.]
MAQTTVSIGSSDDEYECDCDEVEFDGVMLPPRFTNHRLDHDDDSAREAADELRQVDRDLSTVHRTLRLYARALQEAEPHSRRASHARSTLREAIDALDLVVERVDSAHIYLRRSPDRLPAAETGAAAIQQDG